jgi:hypothetical protein
LQEVHKQIVEAERPYGSSRERVALLDSLLNDPDWAWLRALSKLIADLDESLDEDEELTSEEAEAAAGRSAPCSSGSVSRATKHSCNAIGRCYKKAPDLRALTVRSSSLSTRCRLTASSTDRRRARKARP